MFEIIAESRIQQQFIENERIPLLSFIHDFFNDRKIQIRIILNPDSDKNEPEAEQTLSQKEQYIKMVTMYPIIKELRDKLNLDLDYWFTYTKSTISFQCKSLYFRHWISLFWRNFDVQTF